MIYHKVTQILKKRGKHYQIIAPELAEFFSPTGDYHFHYLDKNCLTNSTGGNAWNWKLVKSGASAKPFQHVEIDFQFSEQQVPTICIRLEVFRRVVKLLGDSRKQT